MFLLLLLLTTLTGDVFTGKVVRVVDGDTIVILNEKKEQVKFVWRG